MLHTVPLSTKAAMVLFIDMEKRILVIEDEPDIRDAMVETISDAGYTTLSAKDGRSGLQCALQEQPDLILLDLMMPHMNGTEVLTKLRQDPWGQKVPVIILTSMDDVTNIATTHEHHIADYVIKSHASLDEILQKVRIALFTD